MIVGGDDVVLLMSSGLIGALPEAVLAYLVGGDSRVMGAVLGPVPAADE